MSAMFTIAPPCLASSGAASCARNSGARRFDPMSSSQWPASMDPSAVGEKVDALFTSRWSRPERSAEARGRAGSRGLLERIGAELAAADNWISFARYMELALHEPGLGYYAGGTRKLGAGGDFVTAPELSPLFGRALARQVAQLLEP